MTRVGPTVTHEPYADVNCGKLLYELEPTTDDERLTNFLKFDSTSGEISVSTKTNSLVGDYKFIWKIKYEDYPAISYTSSEFIVEISSCMITEIVPAASDSSLDDIEFLIGVDKKEVEFQAFT